MAELTGWSGLDTISGIRVLIAAGTSRLEGTFAAIGVRSSRSTSPAVMPTPESDRLKTTCRLSRRWPSMSIMSRAWTDCCRR